MYFTSEIILPSLIVQGWHYLVISVTLIVIADDSLWDYCDTFDSFRSSLATERQTINSFVVDLDQRFHSMFHSDSEFRARHHRLCTGNVWVYNVDDDRMLHNHLSLWYCTNCHNVPTKNFDSTDLGSRSSATYSVMLLNRLLSTWKCSDVRLKCSVRKTLRWLIWLRQPHTHNNQHVHNDAMNH